MTKSDNPQGDGSFFAPPQQIQNPGQQLPPAQMDPGTYPPGAQQLPPPHPGAAHQPHHGTMGQPHPQAGQPPAPMQQQIAGQLPPPMPTNQEAYGEYAAPQYEAPVDDYQYPQGQSVLPEVPAVAVPPSMHAPMEQAMVPAQQIPAMQQQITQNAFGDAAASTGEQISQRLAQLQNQYDEEVSAENWGQPQNANTAPHQGADPYAAQSPVSQETAGYAPQSYAHAEQYGQPEEVSAQHYQEQPSQAFQQPHQGYQEQLVSPPPMPAPQGSYEHAGPTPDSPQNQHGQEGHLYAGGSSIPQEPTGGGIKKIMFGGAFIAALAVGGGAAYTYQYTDLFGSRSARGPAPTIKAASSPIKILKQKIAGAGESINKAMHNRLSSSDAASNSSSGGETIEKVVNLAIGGRGVVGDKVTAASNGMMPDSAITQTGDSIGFNTPRRVKTLIVRPDGTILRPAGNDLAKAKAKEGVANLAELSSGANAPSALKAGAFNVAGTNKIRRMKTIGEASSARILGNNGITSLQKPGSNNIPQTQIVKKTIVKKAIKVKKPIIVAKAAPAQSTGTVGKPFVVQVTSRSSQTSALAAFADMRQKYPNLIGAYTPDIQRADLGTKGVWYRLRVGPVGSKVAASDLCSSLKQAGHPGCFVRRK